MAVEEMDATPVLAVDGTEAVVVEPKKQRGRAFVVGIVVGIAAGAVAVWMLNRAAEQEEALAEEPVVELQPALAAVPMHGAPVVVTPVAPAMHETERPT